MDFILSYNNREGVMVFPVVPNEAITLSRSQKNETFDSVNGEMQAPGTLGLATFELESFVPTHDYSFIRPGGKRPWLLILPLLCAGMLALGYGYHVLLRGEDLAVDIAIYVLLMAAGFWLPTRFSGPFQGIRWILPAILTALLGVLLALFTLWPLENILFTELSAVRTWLTMPI